MKGEENFGSTPIARTLVRFSLTLANGISRITPESAKRWMDTRFRKDEAIIADGAAFDLVRASVNLVLAGLLIAVGTSLKLPSLPLMLLSWWPWVLHLPTVPGDVIQPFTASQVY